MQAWGRFTRKEERDESQFIFSSEDVKKYIKRLLDQLFKFTVIFVKDIITHEYLEIGGEQRKK